MREARAGAGLKGDIWRRGSEEQVGYCCRGAGKGTGDGNGGSKLGMGGEKRNQKVL